LNREIVYGRRPVREVIRAGRRQILDLSATERALASEPWLRDETGLRVHVEREGKLNELAGSRDHQGVVAFCEPYRYADAYELAVGVRPLIACLDQVTDPQNLGAVCRSAGGPICGSGRPPVTPRRRSGRPTSAPGPRSSSVPRAEACVLSCERPAMTRSQSRWPELWNR
jgi:23S rRNA (guanosine2251-2'-O)-methyltransferase